MLLEHLRNCIYGNCRGDMDMVMVLSLALSAIYILRRKQIVERMCIVHSPQSPQKKSLQILLFLYAFSGK